MLRCTAFDNPTDWPQKLPIIMAAYHMSPHKTTGVTPNYAMLGREVLLPSTLMVKPPDSYSCSALRMTLPRQHA